MAFQDSVFLAEKTECSQNVAYWDDSLALPRADEDMQARWQLGDQRGDTLPVGGGRVADVKVPHVLQQGLKLSCRLSNDSLFERDPKY